MRTVEELRPLTAGALLALWRRYRETCSDGLERTLLCNAAILREACFCQGEAVYEDELAVLRDMTAREMETLLVRLAEGGGGEPVNPDFDSGRFDAMRGV